MEPCVFIVFSRLRAELLLHRSSRERNDARKQYDVMEACSRISYVRDDRSRVSMLIDGSLAHLSSGPDAGERFVERPRAAGGHGENR
jgi:hypothetical protein